MRALVLLAVLAGSARADDEIDDSYDPISELRAAFRYRDGRGCYDHLAVLRLRNVPDTTKIAIKGPSNDLPAGMHSIGHIRGVCERQMRANARFDAEVLIFYAVGSPRTGADECVERWPLMIAAGVEPTERAVISVPRRGGGWVKIAGTLQQLYVKYCENAYTPRRRGE